MAQPSWEVGYRLSPYLDAIEVRVTLVRQPESDDLHSLEYVRWNPCLNGSTMLEVFTDTQDLITRSIEKQKGGLLRWHETGGKPKP